MTQSCEELRTSNFYVSLFLEGIGVGFLVFITGIMIIRSDPQRDIYVTESSIVIGLTLAALTQSFKDVSGAHLNPAITMASLLTRRVSMLRALAYIIFQCSGAILGALCIQEMVPNSKDAYLGMTMLAPNVSLVKGIEYEMVFTFIYTLSYFASKSSKETFKGFGGPLVLGLFYGASHIVILRYTGCSLNPARSFGPAVMMQQFEDHWIYWAGPILAACFAGLLHDFIFQRARSKIYPRARSCSVCCYKPTREEASITEYNHYNEEPISYRGAIIRQPTENEV